MWSCAPGVASAVVGWLVEDVLELRAVAKPAQLRPEHRPVAAVLVGAHVGHGGLPPGRVGPVGESGAAAAPVGGRVLVAVVPVHSRPALQQAISAAVRA